MRLTTLCYIERDGKWLLLLRNKKKNDLNAGKYVGVGGGFEAGETAEMCLRREVREETGLTLAKTTFYGVVSFRSDVWQDEEMYLYTAVPAPGEVGDCDEGTLVWVDKAQAATLPMWEGDRLFFERIHAQKPFAHMTLRYEGDALVYADCDGDVLFTR